ncbi:hypothetical protein QYM36_015801 [Artemia franciscana]|uniref:Protein kinase domain-containing protein n=1 Tax=Artemia franciscana TaxID=6661 RepID=A0AA88HDN2_ARTSF|nr:hypothetical protein QYM36_015801 [Artemia franciscana]
MYARAAYTRIWPIKKLTFLCQIATALKLVHNMGFLHLAISSHSIHIVSPTQAKLGNFEFAIHARGELKNCLYVQRPWDVFKNIYWRWMSPEVMERKVPTKESDIFSLCMVAKEVIAGKLPWEDKNLKDVLDLITSDYSLPGIKILNLKRLGANKPPTQQVPHRPPPILLFSVTDIATKVKILKKSVELKADIQFHSDESREDRAKRKSATEELKRRIANGETDLGVRNGKVVSKNGQRAPPPALGAMEH